MATILVVEDEPDIAELVKYHLEKAGLPARAVADGKQALGLLASSVSNQSPHVGVMPLPLEKR